MSNPKNSLLFLRRLSGGSSLVENEFREQLTPGPPLSDICTNTSGIGTSVIDDSLLSSSSHSHLREINNGITMLVLLKSFILRAFKYL